MSAIKHQDGAVLITTMIIMVVATIILTGTFNSMGVDLQMVDNRLDKWRTENTAIEVSENILSSIDNFNAPTAQAFTQDGYTITVTTANCIREAPAAGYSALAALVPQQTYWQYDVVVNDPITGAQATVHQGVKIKMLSGSCPI